MNIKDFYIDLSKIGPDKLEELVLYVIELSDRDNRFASTKLNKLVFRADLEAFCRTGRTISGATYQKEKFGPVPRAMPIILDRLKRENRIDVEEIVINSKPAVRQRAKASPDLSAFSPRDLEIISKVVAENFGKSGTKMSNETHTRLAYSAFKIGETIPFAAWLIRPGTLTQKDIDVAAELEEKATAFHARP